VVERYEIQLDGETNCLGISAAHCLTLLLILVLTCRNMKVFKSWSFGGRNKTLEAGDEGVISPLPAFDSRRARAIGNFSLANHYIQLHNANGLLYLKRMDELLRSFMLAFAFSRQPLSKTPKIPCPSALTIDTCVTVSAYGIPPFSSLSVRRNESGGSGKRTDSAG
jgi:hypothetical protein